MCGWTRRSGGCILRLLEEQGVVVGYECQYKRKDGSNDLGLAQLPKGTRRRMGGSLIDEGFIARHHRTQADRSDPAGERSPFSQLLF